MPRLLILRECVCVEGRGRSTNADAAMRESSVRGRGREEEKDHSAAAVLRRGTFDVGSIDYRGQYVSFHSFIYFLILFF